MEMKWGPMVTLSVLFHLMAFVVILFFPEAFISKRVTRGIGPSIEVNLVELPGGGAPQPGRISPVQEKTGQGAVPKEAKARRIEEPKKEEKPLVIAKKTAEKKAVVEKQPSSSEILNDALKRIENRVRTEAHLQDAITKLQAKVGGPGGVGPGSGPGSGPGAGRAGGMGGIGGPMAVYVMEVEQKIRSNWSYPVGMEARNDLEAVVVLMVRADGTIQKVRLEKKSLSPMFDQSVLRAVERSDPLPPFPETYKKSYEEIEINFNLSDVIR